MSGHPSEIGRRGTLLIVAVALLALVAGVTLLAAVGGEVAMITGIALVGLAGIALVALAFLLIGQGEDRDRIDHPHG
jgi:hypothetical protein